MGKISMTMDLWSDPNLTPFMAVTAHWIEGTTAETVGGPKLTLKLQADLIGFQQVSGRHDGRHLAHTFLFVIDRIKIAGKVSRSLSTLMLLWWFDPISRLGGSPLTTHQIMIHSWNIWNASLIIRILYSQQSKGTYGELSKWICDISANRLVKLFPTHC